MGLVFNSFERINERINEGYRIVMFPCTSRLDDLGSDYDLIMDNAVFFYDNNPELNGELFKVKDRDVPVRFFSDDEIIPKDTIILVLSHVNEIKTDLYNNISLVEENVFYFPLISESRIDEDFSDIAIIERHRKNVLEYYNRAKGIYGKNKLKLDNKYRLLCESIINNDNARGVFSTIDLVLNSTCTLKCKDCFAAIPYLEHKVYDLDRVINSIDRFMESIDLCIQMELIGGEPFLYKDLEKVLDYCLIQEKILFVQISTNGTIPPATESLMEKLRNPRVIVDVSVYENQTKSEVCRKMESYGINVEYKHNIWKKGPETDCNRLLSLGYDDNELQAVYRGCGWKCNTIMNGRFYGCYRIAMLNEVGSYDIEEKDYADILEEDTVIRKESIHRVLKLEYSKGCNYCTIHDPRTPYVAQGVQIASTKA